VANKHLPSARKRRSSQTHEQKLEAQRKELQRLKEELKEAKLKLDVSNQQLAAVGAQITP